MRLGAVIPALAIPTIAGADLRLEQPIACDLGQDCYIQQFVDADPGPGVTDFTCGPLSYDGHQGTDFALNSLADLALGVPVLAAADGIVRGVRDEMPDALQISPDAPDVTGRECGNGVVIEHGDGWSTQYCHMALGSVSVIPGDTVRAGQPIGDVGLSGQTQFPHLHITVRQNGQVVDPFRPEAADTCGAPTGDTLWDSTPVYAPGGLIAAGFSTEVPAYDQIKAGLPPSVLSADAPLVLWGYLFGGRAGDAVRLEINGPEGEVFAQDVDLTRTQAQLFRAGGRRAPPVGWASGAYSGTVSLFRAGEIIDSLQVIGLID